MKEQNLKQKQGQLINITLDKFKETQVGSIYIQSVNELTLVRLPPHFTDIQQLMNDHFPIGQQTGSCRLHHQATTVFEVFKDGGCEVTYISAQQQQECGESEDYERILALEEKKVKNQQSFLEKYGISKQIKQCYTVLIDDGGGILYKWLVFQDDQHFYQLGTVQIWPGYE